MSPTSHAGRGASYTPSWSRLCQPRGRAGLSEEPPGLSTPLAVYAGVFPLLASLFHMLLGLGAYAERVAGEGPLLFAEVTKFLERLG